MHTWCEDGSPALTPAHDQECPELPLPPPSIPGVGLQRAHRVGYLNLRTAAEVGAGGFCLLQRQEGSSWPSRREVRPALLMVFWTLCPPLPDPGGPWTSEEEFCETTLAHVSNSMSALAHNFPPFQQLSPTLVPLIFSTVLPLSRVVGSRGW